MTPTWSYATIRTAPVDGYIAITDGSRHVLARMDGPGVPAGAQRRVNACKANGKPPADRDLAEVASWLRRHLVQEWCQDTLFEIAA